MSKKLFYSMVIVLLLAIGFVSYLIIMPQKIEEKQELTQAKDVSVQAIPEQRPEKIRIEANNCPTNSGSVDITLITDTNYIVPTKVSMYSAIKNKCPNTIYNFYIIAENITKDDEQSIRKMKNIAPDTVNIKIIEQPEPDLPFENMQRFLQYKVGMHKIFLPNILNELDKVIYMDGDTLVLKDLRALYDIDVKDVYASVAKDGIFYRFPKEMAEMEFDKRGYYFNSGVMLHNLALQRQDNTTDKMVDYINHNTDFYGDQDVLNVVFGNKLKLMSYRYNCISTFFEADDLTFLSQYFNEELPKDTFYIYEGATVLHYAGDKPWYEKFQPDFLKELWFRYYYAMESEQ